MSPDGLGISEVPDRKRGNLDGVLAKSDILLLGVGDSHKVSISEQRVGLCNSFNFSPPNFIDQVKQMYICFSWINFIQRPDSNQCKTSLNSKNSF